MYNVKAHTKSLYSLVSDITTVLQPPASWFDFSVEDDNLEDMMKPHQPENVQLNGHSMAFGLVGLHHNIFKSSSSREKADHKTGIFGEGLLIPLGHL